MTSHLIFYPFLSSSSVSRKYVNFINCMKNSHLITPSLYLHSSPGRTWNWPIVRRTLVSSSHPIPFSSSVSRKYVDLVNCLKTSYLIFPFLTLQGSMWTWSIVFKTPHLIILSRMYANFVKCLKTPHLIILFFFFFIGQLIYDLKPDHPIPFSTSISRAYRSVVWILVIWLSSPGCTWTWSAVWIPSSDHPIPPSSFVSRMYVNMINCLNALHLIIPSSSSISRKYLNVWIILRPLMWFSFPSSSSVSRGRMSTWPIRLNTPHLIVLSRAYVNYLNCLNTPHPLSSPGFTWSRSIVYSSSDLLILSSSSFSRHYVNLVDCF